MAAIRALPGLVAKSCCLERCRMEERYFPELNEEFLRELKANLIQCFDVGANFGLELSDFDGEELWLNLGGTVGYGAAFVKTCASLGLSDLCDYYTSMEWDASDNFDSEVLDLAIKLGVVTPMEIGE